MAQLPEEETPEFLPSSAAVAAANAQFTDKVWLMLLQISHATLPTPIRVVNNTEDIVSGGNTYLKAAFDMPMPDDTEDSPSVQIVIDNVDRAIVDSARSISSPATVTLSVVLSDTPDVIEAGPFNMQLVRVSYDKLKVTGTLIYEDILNDQFPSQTFNPARYPGIY